MSSVDYEQVYRKTVEGLWPSYEVNVDAAGIAAVVAAASEQALIDAADKWTQGDWAHTPRDSDRIADRMKASQYAGDWMRARSATYRTPGGTDK